VPAKSPGSAPAPADCGRKGRRGASGCGIIAEETSNRRLLAALPIAETGAAAAPLTAATIHDRVKHRRVISSLPGGMLGGRWLLKKSGAAGAFMTTIESLHLFGRKPPVPAGAVRL
jgi:hypothetical protein